jgi:uncharacterized protein YjdB
MNILKTTHFSLKKLVLPVLLLMALTGGVLVWKMNTPAVQAGSGDLGNIISDYKFDQVNSMSEADINNFLNQFPSSCLLARNYPTGLSWATWREPLTYWDYTGHDVSPARIIYKSAQMWGLNPQVLLTTLEKEQTLVSGTAGCSAWRYNSAMGYNCPDSWTYHNYANLGIYDTCVGAEGNAGFSRQVNRAAWQLKFGKERANGNIAWDDDCNVYYYGYMTEGNRSRGCGQLTVGYDGWYTISGYNIKMKNGATASLYSYTPHAPQSFETIFERWFGSAQAQTALISYQAHIGGVGWQDIKTDGIEAGTTGQNKSMEALRLYGDFNYSVYTEKMGWQPTVNRDMVAGTVGHTDPLKAVKISLGASMSSKYDIYYQVHVSGVGWMGWAKNGEPAGTISDKDIEAIKIVILSKGLLAPGSTDDYARNINDYSNKKDLDVQYQSHVSGIGWQNQVKTDMISGTMSQSRAIEAVKVSLDNNTGVSGSISYQVHATGVGWMNVSKNGEIAGTTGQTRQLEATRFKLNGDIENYYDIYYRSYISGLEWLGWVKNGESSGSVGQGLRLEAIEIRIIKKNQDISPIESTGLYNPKNLSIPSINTAIGYRAHIDHDGWLGWVSVGGAAGSTGRNLSLQAINFQITTSLDGLSGEIACRVHVSNIGWIDYKNNSCGTVGRRLAIEAVQLELKGDLANKYDVQYRVHASGIGWMDWVNSGEITGTTGQSRQLEAIEVRLIGR